MRWPSVLIVLPLDAAAMLPLAEPASCQRAPRFFTLLAAADFRRRRAAAAVRALSAAARFHAPLPPPPLVTILPSLPHWLRQDCRYFLSCRRFSFAFR